MEERKVSWFEHIVINSYWLGINIGSGILTPLLVPYLVLLFMPEAQKNTSLANLRVIGLAVAMLVQPLIGLLSDRSTSPMGRRRPFIIAGALGNVVFLAFIGATPLFVDSPWNGFFQAAFGVSAAYAILLIASVFMQLTSNFGQAGVQALMPDVVPENQRGRSSGVKSVMELLPVFLVLFVGPLVDKGRVGLVVGIIAAGFILTMLLTVIFVHETPLKQKPGGSITEPVLRLVGLTVIFVAVTRLAVWLVAFVGSSLSQQNVDPALQILAVGATGLVGMAGSIFLGVYFGARVGIGKEAGQQKSFIWWVINRLMFLAAVGSIQAFALYYLRDVLHIPNAAFMTTVLLAAVAVFLIPSAIFGGNLADRIGRKRLIYYSGFIAAGGTLLLLFSQGIAMVVVAGCIIGLATGTFFATNWALGTDLVPAKEAGRYLGISNLAGAGAGIVGAGIGGPMADFFNAVQPGLGYLVIFAIYGALFLLSTLALTQVRTARE